MQSFAILLLCMTGVFAHSPVRRIEEEPTVPIPEECQAQVEPLQQVLHTSLHDQRHVVHQECRAELHTERENHRRERDNLRRSLRQCHDMASRLRIKNPVEAADLIRQCDMTASHLLQDRSYIHAISAVHQTCNHNLERVNVRVRNSAVRLVRILATCSRPHACYMYRLIKASILSNVDQVHSQATGDVQSICRQPNLVHDLRRSCERFNLSSSILIQSESTLPQELHDELAHCDDERIVSVRLPSVAPATHRVPSTPRPTLRELEHHPETAPKAVPTTHRVPNTPRPTPRKTEHHPETAPKIVHITYRVPSTPQPTPEKMEHHPKTAKPVTDKKVVSDPVPVENAKETSDDDLEGVGGMSMGGGPVVTQRPNKPEPQNKDATKVHKHHASHHSLTVAMIATVGVLCVIVTVLSAALTLTLLRRRAVRPGPGARELQVPLTDADQLEQIKTKGYENPTYTFFEGTEE